ncbi:MAG: YqhA family protein [Halioglobus sp.]
MNNSDPYKLLPLPALIFGFTLAAIAVPQVDRRAGRVRGAVQGLIHLIAGATSLSEQLIMLAVLGLIDVVMISNLLVMVIVGGYETFVSRLQIAGPSDLPEWLNHRDATVLKVKRWRWPSLASVRFTCSRRLSPSARLGTEFRLHGGRGHVANHHPRGVYPVSDRYRLDRLSDDTHAQGAQTGPGQGCLMGRRCPEDISRPRACSSAQGLPGLPGAIPSNAASSFSASARSANSSSS